MASTTDRPAADSPATGDLALGATPLEAGRWRVVVWAPLARRVDVLLTGPESTLTLQRDERGYHVGTLDAREAGTRYWVRLDDGPLRPDPASRWQPEGVHGPSALVDPGTFTWSDRGWRGVALEDSVMYELHVGTFTDGGSFDDVIAELDELADLGVTTIELMPLSEFPGARNWGYDGVLPFAVQSTYGGPAGLARLVDACHGRGLAVLVDVVYNHLGPEGNHLREFGPYFTDAYRTPWGDALNFSGPGSDEVRRYFIESARWLVRDLHVDGLRVDAVHAIADPTAMPFVEELCRAVHDLAADLGRTVLVVAESSANDPRTVRGPERGGWGFDGQWNDDFHHALRVALTGERDGYYRDYHGVADLARCIEHRFVLDGRWSELRQRRHGRDAGDVAHHRLVAFAQNHDQIGNRMFGERLTTGVSLEAQKAAAALVLLGPFTPLLFMGEEYGELAPFPYFVDHGDPALLEAVRRGRTEEFADFAWRGEPPDPAAPATFRSAVLRRPTAAPEPHRTIRGLHGELLRLRRTLPPAGRPGTVRAGTAGDGRVLVVERAAGDERAVLVVNLSPDSQTVELPAGAWSVVLDTAAPRWGGPGPADFVHGSLAPIRAWSAVLAVAGPRP